MCYDLLRILLTVLHSNIQANLSYTNASLSPIFFLITLDKNLIMAISRTL